MAAIEEKLKARPAAEWEALFVARGIPAGVVRTVPEVAREIDPIERGLVQPVQLSDGTTVNIVGSGFRFEHEAPRLQGGVPALGEATDSVLTALGYSAADIARLRRTGVI